MNYYCIRYLQERDELDDYPFSVYYYLPTAYTVTTDKELALRWFDEVVNQLKGMFDTKIINVRDVELNHRCIIKEAKYETNQPAFAHGKYIVALKCYSFNPLEK